MDFLEIQHIALSTNDNYFRKSKGVDGKISLKNELNGLDWQGYKAVASKWLQGF